MKKAILLICAFFMLKIPVCNAYTGVELHKSMERVFAWIDDNASPLGDTDSVAADYFVMAMSRGNRTFDYNKYAKITKSKGINTIQDAHRIIMSNAASGGRFNQKFIADNTYERNYTNSGDLSGAILAIKSGDYQVKSEYTSIDEMTAELLTFQQSNGSFDNDTLVTAKSIIALSFMSGKQYAVKGESKDEVYYYDVNSSILSGVNYLQGAMSEDGGYGNIMNTAYVIMALDSVGIDADNDPGFCDDDTSPLKWLIQRQNEDGSFGEFSEDTSLAACAIVSHMRAMQGKAPFFAMRSDDKVEDPSTFVEDVNFSGRGFENEPVEGEYIDIKLSKIPQEAELSEGDSVYEDTVYPENMDNKPKPVKIKLYLVLLIITASILILLVVSFFIMYRMGIKPKKLWHRNSKDDSDD